MRQDEFVFRDMHGKKINPNDMRKFDRFTVLERKGGNRLGIYTKKEWERKFL